ncbi:hypothetical protein MASR2M8_08370 [Opitutaceae bacterium]
MAQSFLPRLSAAFFTALGRFATRCADAIRARPALAAWFEVPETAEDVYRRENLRAFSRLSEQERMLADGPRMAFYHEAVTRSIRPGDRVIDLGTGTGILAAFAARRGAGKVYALDHSSILDHARELAQYNGINGVEFVSIHSRDFTLREQVDVILHEQMGDFLFDEAMVANVTDLRDRLLKPGGIIVPARFELYCEPVKANDDRRVPFIWELNVHGYDYSPLAWHRPQAPRYYHHHGCDPTVIDRFLGTPQPALTFDLHTLLPDQLPKEIRVVRTVERAGRLDGFAVFFRALADDTLSLSSNPLDRGRAPHWGFPILRTESVDYAAGDQIELTLSAENWADPETWRWRHRRHDPQSGFSGQP